MVTVTMALLAACGNDGKYEIKGEHVVYSYWTFSFGPLSDTLPEADPATFVSVNRWLGHDNSHAYYKNKLIPDVDVESFEAVRYPLSRDKHDYYYESTPLHVSDVESFKTLRWFEHDFWAVDSRYAYFDTVRVDGVDLSTFELLDMPIARDKSHVYSLGKVIPLADPSTFEVIGNSLYYRDRAHIWCGDELMEDVDYATFEVDGISKAHDKYGSFSWEKRDSVEAE